MSSRFKIKIYLALFILCNSYVSGLYAAPHHQRLHKEEERVSSQFYEHYDHAKRAFFGIVAVPLSYEKIHSKKIELAYMIRLANKDPFNKETLWINYGGPGIRSIQVFEEQFADSSFPQELLDDYNIVMLDARGTGFSAYGHKLAGGNKSSRLGKHLSSNILVNDLETLRQHLSHTAIQNQRLQKLEQINLLGISYGTLVMAKYAEQHPLHVRSLILDSVADFNAYNHPSRTQDLIQSYQQVLDISPKPVQIELIDGNLSQDRQVQRAVKKMRAKLTASYQSSILIHCADQGYQPGVVYDNHDRAVWKIIYFNDVSICRNVEQDLLKFDKPSNLAQLEFPTLILSSKHDYKTPYLWAKTVQQDYFEDHAVMISINNSPLHGISFLTNRKDPINSHILSYLKDPMSYINLPREISYSTKELNSQK